MCYLCLKRGNHLAKNCFSKIKCDSCGWKHNSLICDRNSLDEKKSNKKDLNLTNKSCLEKVLLQTLVVRVRGNGPEKYCRCLIDSGSQRSYVSKFLANAMQYECINESSVIHSLFGGTEVVETHKQFVVRLSSIKNDYQCNFKAFDQANICSDIPQLNIKPYLNELKTHNIFLNDVEGADIAGKLLTGKIKKLECGLVCIETYLGWSIMGKIPVEMENKYDCSYAFSIDEEGRFQVCLPWIENRSLLPNYREIAEKRLKSTVKNLRDGGFLEDYNAIFKSWEDDKIIEIVPEEEVNNPSHYLPHRAVIRMNSTTTKIRPVFDGSVRTKGSPSVNDCLEKGPNLIDTVPAIINRFRLGKIGVSADIKKAFLQIALNPKDRDYLRFLWWEQGNSERLKIYRHRRVVFGITSSPFLLNATLTKLMNEVPENYRASANKLVESWYVDNLVTSVNDESELKKLKK
ncbi:uncharacterized protein LOC118201426 [Stegodyphus dumicola]|uniref:uncharacterized protein LOC118201426 n=1 Tax=Stegodyphus dumicola TaxID=202533 RepID=UPI0015A98F63|nr:uncharacterized protein LOC118201426 [Stegodyphus dumicola]